MRRFLVNIFEQRFTEWTRKLHFIFGVLCVPCSMNSEFSPIYLSLSAWTVTTGANAGAATLTLARFFLTKIIFVFLYLNICYLNYMLVYRLTVHQQKYLYFREDIQYRLGFTQEVLRFLLDWSHSISKVRHFLKTYWMCLGFLHTSMLNYYYEIVYCDLSFVDEFVRKWQF